MREIISGRDGSAKSCSCPICGKSGAWKEGVQECSQCGSNLDILTNVCDLPDPKKQSTRDEYRERPKQTLVEWVAKFSLVLISALTLSLFASMALFAHLYHRQMQEHVTSLHKANEFFSHLLVEQIKGVHNPSSNHGEEKIEESESVNIRHSAPERYPKREKVHTLREGETLQEIAQQYWGKEAYYPLLLEYNAGVSLLTQPSGFQIKIPLDMQQVESDYERFVIVLADGAFLRYLVRREDTWQGITRHLWGEGKDTLLLERLNSFRLAPGERILVPLEEQ